MVKLSINMKSMPCFLSVISGNFYLRINHYTKSTQQLRSLINLIALKNPKSIVFLKEALNSLQIAVD